MELRLQRSANAMISVEASASKGLLGEAMATIDKAIENDPQNGFVVMTKARMLKRQAQMFKPPDEDNLKQAITYADRAVALLPNQGEAIYNKACYQALLDPNGLKSEVLKNLKAAFRLNPALRQTAKHDNDLLGSLKDDGDFAVLTGLDQPPGA